MSKITKCPTCHRYKELECLRKTCGHIWTPDNDKPDKKCPKCKNPHISERKIDKEGTSNNA